METREKILAYMDLSPELETLFAEIIDLKEQYGFEFKKNALKFIGHTEEETRQVDSSYPEPYAQQVRDIYPDFRNGNYVYSYINDRSFGELINLNNGIAKRILEPIKLG